MPALSPHARIMPALSPHVRIMPALSPHVRIMPALSLYVLGLGLGLRWIRINQSGVI
jgi:hypothetical protein